MRKSIKEDIDYFIKKGNLQAAKLLIDAEKQYMKNMKIGKRNNGKL